ncbi:triple tyrosine motif-containing protein [Roseimarinus sediminis]|jgi:ligand-binding sensor domain-containing protein/DNA-binding CsgD family transcriptional regulator|uniref:triple tyrosine motif-containing protein n=1 Tax=Roseimarinus sediminis TaxID=1610899 RepID=UPI003D1B8C35
MVIVAKNSIASHRFLFFILLFLGFSSLQAAVKRIGVPVIQNFERSVYHAGTQNWGIAQGSNGVMYYGNNSGLLRYDGQFWNSFSSPNGSNIRSVFFSEEKQRLFVGAYNEFGYYINDSIGHPEYISLLPLIPEIHRQFGDVWKIHETAHGVVFQSFEGMYIYDGQQIEVIVPRSTFHFSYYVNGVLYVHDRENGLLEYRNGFLRKIPGSDFFIHLEVWTMLALNNDELLIGTARDGLFVYDGLSLKPWETPVNPLLKEYQIYSSSLIDDEHFAFGTIQNGLIICNRQGDVIQMINREKGLQNNTILSMCLDIDGNLWLGLDNGIDYVEINSPITLLQDFYDFGTGYTSIAFNDTLYLGTNQGLFYCKLSDFKKPNLSAADFKMVKNTSGQVWSLQVIEGRLFCGHNNGSYLIDGDFGIQMNDIPGCWAYHAVKGHNNWYLEGTYDGVELCRFEEGVMKHVANVPGVDYSCQEMEVVDDRYVWISHAFNGVKLFRLTPALDSLVLVKQFTADDGLPASYLNKVKRMASGDVLLTTDDGIYQYNPVKDNFFRSAYYNKLFQEQDIQFIQEDQHMNIWYVTRNNEGGVLRLLEDGTYSNVSFPFNKLKGRFIGSFFHFNVIDDTNVLIALEKGYAHYNPKMIMDYRRGYHAAIHSVALLGSGEVLYNGVLFGQDTGPVDDTPQIAYRENSLRFTFSALFYEGNSETLFSYQLEGFDEDWSDWQTPALKEYTNLPDGDFIFRVRSRNKYDVISEAEAFHFTILPPWYKSTGAIIGYFILFLFFIWFWIYLFLKRVEKSRLKEQAIQKKKYQEREEKLKRDALEAEKEIIRLRNDKLRAEMIHKDKELANSAMNLVQKNKQLNKMKAELKKIQSEIREELVKSRIGMMIRKIEKETSNDESWSVFETNFEQVHEDFLKRLREKHPNITPKELKLSAYLRMNISSKEIAALMNITTRGVEISRYRLRKKFDLDRAQNLIDYILSI